MHLYLNDTSPFARLVLVTALEAGADTLELVWIDPWVDPPRLAAANPFCTIPTLQLDTGHVLTESLLICEYLLARRLGTTHTPPVDDEFISRLAFGKTLMETAFRRVILERFSDGHPHPLQVRAEAAVIRALRRLEEYLPADALFGLDAIALAVALDYIAFRLPRLHGAHIGAAASGWLDTCRARPAFRCSTPAVLGNKAAASVRALRDMGGETPAQ